MSNPDGADASVIHEECRFDIFADGCFEPISGDGGWAFVVIRDGVECASDCGGVRDSGSNAMEVVALLNAAIWAGKNARGLPVVIWSDSAYAVNGCNSWRPIWKSWGWRKNVAHPRARSREIANRREWEAIDLVLTENRLIAVQWCKGHSGNIGNERADEMANLGRLSVNL
jgi:ribonuclease HI